MAKRCRYRCVAFDAVGTLIHAEPTVAQAYLAIGQKYGAALTLDEVHRRFWKALDDRQTGLETNEQQEREFWREIVSVVVGPVSDPQACFEELHEHFARPASWRCRSEVAGTLARLTMHGVRIAVASNFDARLHDVLEGLPELSPVRVRVISSEVGWRKPSLRFYQALIAAAECAPEEILMVGDDLENDVTAPREYGLDALHFNPQSRSVPPERSDSIASLAEILNRCGIET